MVEPLSAFWCRIPSRPNFGDALTPWLIRRLTGRYPRFRRADDPRHKFLVTGSVIGLARPPCTVWGAGIMSAHDHVMPGTRVLAVRGPLTRERVLASGLACPPVFGDPALLLPRVYDPPVVPTDAVGLALHFSDRPRVLALRRLPVDIRVIDMQAPIERVIDQIRSCALVASSSLHGLIVTHAYGRPACWVEFRRLPSGDGSKFRDYLSSIGREREGPLRLSPEELNREVVSRHAIDPPESSDLTALWQSCPFSSR